MPRGRKKNYKGGHKHFTDPNEINAKEEKEKKEREWRRQRGLLTDSDEEKEEEGERKQGATSMAAEPGQMPESDSESDEEKEEKHKGITHLIAIENPNLIAPKTKKVTALDDSARPELSRRDREEVQKQQARANYMKAHAAGKTDEAQADLARLSLIRKQREEAAAKRDAERKVADDKKNAAEQKLLDKKAAKR